VRVVRGVLLAALVAVFFVPAFFAQNPNPPEGFCTSPDGECWSVPGIFGAECDEPPNTFSALPCGTPAVYEGDIEWKPEAANYVQGPSAVRDFDGSIYILGNAGFCCEVPGPPGPGWEQVFIIRYGQSEVTALSPAMPWPNDPHEIAFVTVVGHGDGWLVAGVRTTFLSWVIDQNSNRTMIWFAYYSALTRQPDLVLWDAVSAYDYACHLRNSCPGLGPMMPSLIWSSGTLWLFDGDGLGFLAGSPGFVAWTIDLELKGHLDGWPNLTATKQFWTFWPLGHVGTPASDVALADDGTVRALLSGGGASGCWWGNCHQISEWISNDGGHNWVKGTRSWSDSEGRYAWDAGYVKDRTGGISLDSTVLVGLVSTVEAPTSGEWKLHWWADPRAPLPRSWGQEPGWRFQRVRRHLEREPKPKTFVEP